MQHKHKKGVLKNTGSAVISSRLEDLLTMQNNVETFALFFLTNAEADQCFG